MSLEVALIIANALLGVVAVFFGARVLRSTQGGMGGSWRWLWAGLAFFALTSLYRIERAYFLATGSGIKISGLSEVLELIYIALLLVGIVTQVVTYRRLVKSVPA